MRAATFLIIKQHGWTVQHDTFIVSMQAAGAKQLKGLPSLFVLLDKDGEISKVISLQDETGKDFTASVRAVTIAKDIVWTCDDEFSIVGFSKQAIFNILRAPGVYHSLNILTRAKVGVVPAVLLYDLVHGLLWVGETTEPGLSDSEGKAVAYQVQFGGAIKEDEVKAELVYGPDVRGISFFKQLGKKYVAISRCSVGMQACKIEFHSFSLACDGTPNMSGSESGGDAGSATLPNQLKPECDASQIVNQPVWTLKNRPNINGTDLAEVTLVSAAGVPFGAEGLATDNIQGGYFLIPFSSATEEGVRLAIKYAKNIEDSMFLFTVPMLLSNVKPSFTKNVVFCEMFGAYVPKSTIPCMDIFSRALEPCLV